MVPNGSDLPTIGGRGPFGTANGGVDGLSRSRRRDIQCPGVDAIQTLRRLKMQDAARTLQSMHGRWLSCREASGSSFGTIQKPFSSLRQTLSSFHSLSIHLLNTRSVCTNTLLFPLLPRPLLPSTRSSFHACPCRVLVASMERSRRPWARPISPSYRSPSRFPDLTALSSSLV